MLYADGKTEKLAALLWARGLVPARPQILAVGCGSGLEAAILGMRLGGEVTGVDTSDTFDPEIKKLKNVKLLRADATALPWKDERFDLVYSYHALEHIPDYARALSEMARVLAGGGCAVVGTPNRSRLIGYLGAKAGKTRRDKLKSNLIDWQYRLRGKFRNAYGAHAGFTARELETAIRKSFVRAQNISGLYYAALYQKFRRMIGLLQATGLHRYLFPSVYFIGFKE